MIKKLLFLLLFVALVSPVFGQQSGKKLTTDEAARKTPDQRFVYESERKSKKKKKKQISTKKKVRIQEKQEAKMRRKKDPKRRR